MIATRLIEAGVRRAVVSPGARNSTLLQSVADSGMELTPVADERVAAFVGLGMAVESAGPVALLCTSGTALLNYAPALAEALYRRVPLIAVSADRPAVWIDRADSQTLRQPGALDAVVKRSFALPAASGADAMRHSALLLGEAITTATKWPPGPVHINVPIDFEADTDTPFHAGPVEIVGPDMTISTARARELGRSIASPVKVLVAVGGAIPSPRINKALAKLAQLPNVAVVTEPCANVHARLTIPSAEATLAAARPDMIDHLRPDVVITIGGALVSARLKRMLRSTPGLRHWAVGGSICGSFPDTFGALSCVVDMDAEAFMPLLASAMQPHRSPSTFGDDWRVAFHRGEALLRSAVDRAPWCSLKTVSAMLAMVPRRWNLQVSNGMSIRIAGLASAIAGPWHRCDCNRGVSGIDGSTSTAIGASISYCAAPTLLITGDMSALYDLGSLASGIVPPRFRMAVIDNGGGGIFRFSAATRALPCRSRLLEMEGMQVPLKSMAEGCGFDYYEVASMEELRQVWPRFTSEETGRPALMRIITDASTDAGYFNEYYHNSSQR